MSTSHRTIDGHVHLRTTADFKVFERIMISADVSAVNCACILHYYGGSSHANCAALAFKMLHPSKAYVFGGLDHSVPGALSGKADFAQQAKRLMELGADGIKMIEGKPDARRAWRLPLDDRAYDPFYRYLQGNAIPLLFHVADPEEFWDRRAVPQFAIQAGWFWGGGKFVPKEQLYRETLGVLKKFPGLRVTFAHFFFLSADIERAARFFDSWPNVSFDITPGWEMYDNFTKRADEWRDFFVRYRDRIVFGTDNAGGGSGPAQRGVAQIAKMRRFLETKEEMLCGAGLGLDRITLDMIYCKNFQRRAGARPAMVNRAAFRDECERLLARAKAVKKDQSSARELKKIVRMF